MCANRCFSILLLTRNLSSNAHKTRENLFASCQSISTDFVAVYSWSVHCSRRLRKINKKPLFWKFSVFQSHQCWYDWKTGHYCLLWQAACPCLSATWLQNKWKSHTLWRGGRSVGQFILITGGAQSCSNGSIFTHTQNTCIRIHITFVFFTNRLSGALEVFPFWSTKQVKLGILKKLGHKKFTATV